MLGGSPKCEKYRVGGKSVVAEEWKAVDKWRSQGIGANVGGSGRGSWTRS
jgi:hypothetical protein